MSQSNNRKSYGQWCPVARSLDLVGDRWTLLIIRDLTSADRRFSDLRNNLAGISPTLLSTRLRDLGAVDVVTQVNGNYRLTDRGRELEDVVLALGSWGLGELLAPQRSDHFPDDYRLIGLRSMIRGGRTPTNPLVVSLMLDYEPVTIRVTASATSPQVEVNAGAPDASDVSVVASLAGLNMLHLGHASLGELEGAGDVTIKGAEQAKADFVALISR